MHNEGYITTDLWAIWKQPDKVIVWCKTMDLSSAVKRWKGAKDHSTCYAPNGAVIEKSYKFPLSEYKVLLKALRRLEKSQPQNKDTDSELKGSARLIQVKDIFAGS